MVGQQLIVRCHRWHTNRGNAMNIAFQIEALTNSDGNCEVVAIECDPTTEAAK